MSGDLAPLQGLKDESCRGSRREEDERLKEGGAFLSFSKKKKGTKICQKISIFAKKDPISSNCKTGPQL